MSWKCKLCPLTRQTISLGYSNFTLLEQRNFVYLQCTFPPIQLAEQLVPHSFRICRHRFICLSQTCIGRCTISSIIIITNGINFLRFSTYVLQSNLNKFVTVKFQGLELHIACTSLRTYRVIKIEYIIYFCEYHFQSKCKDHSFIYFMQYSFRQKITYYFPCNISAILNLFRGCVCQVLDHQW